MVRKKLIAWYEREKRALPWRVNQDPYRIWISEVMLQQTTVQAVIPYYERFLKRFPQLENLASSSIEDVYEMWAGLGYYSRARNLHKAALKIHELGKFPDTHQKLIELPGFGPYTARAVSSIAFDEPVGVIDGNVIRVLSRLLALDLEWWLPRNRDIYQKYADELAQKKSHTVNQALMELGATVCTPLKYACLLCPLRTNCKSFAARSQVFYPRPKPKVAKEMWSYEAFIQEKGDQVLMIQNTTSSPFLKGHLVLPGVFTKIQTSPQKFDFKGAVTRYDIFVTLNQDMKSKFKSDETLSWVAKSQLKSLVPSSLVRKIIDLKRKPVTRK